MNFVELEHISEVHVVTKKWGSEHWIVNDFSAGYCGKLLTLFKGFQSSLHFHKVKDETMYCVEGLVKVEVGEQGSLETYTLQEGDILRLAPLTPHRFTSLTDVSKLIEFSSFHNDEDVERLEESKQC